MYYEIKALLSKKEGYRYNTKKYVCFITYINIIMDTTIDTLYDIYDIQTYRTQSITYRMSLLIFLLLTFTGKIKRILE